ncbi:MAG: AI-2E family transporter [Treponema sp.]|nr:AI-2E family transporter [Treponema sp.]
MAKRNNFAAAIFFLLLFLSIIAAGVILKLMATVCIPVVVAVLLSFVFLPPVRKLSARPCRLPWWLAILIIYLLFLIGVFVVGNILIANMYRIGSALPRYEERFMTIFQIIATELDLPFDENISFFQNLWNNISSETLSRYAFGIGGTLYDSLRSFLLVMLFSAFLLAEMHLTQDKITYAFDGKNRSRIKRILSNIVSEITRYISIKFVISLTTGTLITLGLLLIGLDFALFWGFVAFIMNFIPTFGSILSVFITTLFALLQFYPSPAPIVGTAIFSTAVNFVLGNILEPRIEGRNLGVSPFIILVSLSLWGWMWGFLGMVMAVPIMVIAKIICENFSYLHPVAIFLGNRPQDTQKEFSKDEDEDE